MRTLLEREWVRIVGHRDVPGRPALYGTTRDFLDYFGLKSLDDLPTLAEIRDLDVINEELKLPEPDGEGAQTMDKEGGDMQEQEQAGSETRKEPGTAPDSQAGSGQESHEKEG